MSKGGNSKAYSEQWFLDRLYTKNKDGSFSPPALKSEFIRGLKSSPKLQTVQRQIFNPNPNYVKQQLDDLTFLSIHSKPLVVFDIIPIGAPRMTRSDKWKLDPTHTDEKRRQRKPVTQYFRFQREIQALAMQTGFKLPESGFHVVFIVPMPHSWSDKKKNQMNSAPHQQKPDTDNMIKAVKDSLCENDANIWDYRITKYWGRSGKIVIYNIN